MTGRGKKQNKIKAEIKKNNNNNNNLKIKINGSIISSKKRTQVLLHSAALVSLIEGLQYKTRLVIDSKNKTKTHLCIQKHGFPPSNLGGKKKKKKRDLKVPFYTIRKNISQYHKIIKKNP